MNDYQMDYSTSSQSKVLGVCSWLSNIFGVNVTYIRIGFVLATIFGWGSPIFFYFFLAAMKFFVTD